MGLKIYFLLIIFLSSSLSVFSQEQKPVDPVDWKELVPFYRTYPYYPPRLLRNSHLKADPQSGWGVCQIQVFEDSFHIRFCFIIEREDGISWVSPVITEQIHGIFRSGNSVRLDDGIIQGD